MDGRDQNPKVSSPAIAVAISTPEGSGEMFPRGARAGCPCPTPHAAWILVTTPTTFPHLPPFFCHRAFFRSARREHGLRPFPFPTSLRISPSFHQRVKPARPSAHHPRNKICTGCSPRRTRRARKFGRPPVGTSGNPSHQPLRPWNGREFTNPSPAFCHAPSCSSCSSCSSWWFSVPFLSVRRSVRFSCPHGERPSKIGFSANREHTQPGHPGWLPRHSGTLPCSVRSRRFPWPQPVQSVDQP